MFLRAGRSLTRSWLVRKTRQVQHIWSHRGVLSWRRVQAQSWTCNFVSFLIQFNSRTQILHLRKGEQIGPSTVSSTSTLVNIEVLSENEKYCLRITKQKGLLAQTKFCHNTNAYFWNLLIAVLDPIDRVQQPRSRTTCDGWWARFKGTDAIHAVSALEQYHPVAEVEESSVKLENQSSDSQAWPYPSSLSV